ncbi:MAG: xylanase [Lachnospiraceae bacterium]|nr:xylanase [Lachnospiraceae bacterium]
MNYRNLFKEAGIPEEEVTKRVRECFDTIYNGPEGVRFYENVGPDMGYITDTGNNDVRTEGMSYAMMVCVQMDEKEKFDRIWAWTKKYMWIAEGWGQGYFKWSCSLDGTVRGQGPAPDGEEYFAMALFFASHRWGDGEGIYNYSEEAKAILRAALHNGEEGRPGKPMWNHDNHYIKFTDVSEFSDTSYHLPHFYELFAKWADEEDRPFWEKAAKASREYIVKSSHPLTGLSPEYSDYDGKPFNPEWVKRMNMRHDRFFSDAYRTIANIALDSCWSGSDKALADLAAKIQRFFTEDRGGVDDGIFEIDGTMVEEHAKHNVGLLATNAEGSLAVLNNPDADEKSKEYALNYVRKLWNTPMQTGKHRYYDNCLYMFAMLALSGNYRIY